MARRDVKSDVLETGLKSGDSWKRPTLEVIVTGLPSLSAVLVPFLSLYLSLSHPDIYVRARGGSQYCLAVQLSRSPKDA